jgi:beta-lactamase superfamily II metal-dependent hydrolase
VHAGLVGIYYFDGDCGDVKRRTLLKSFALTGLFASPGRTQGSPTFEPWKPGTLDIHHLAYGRGNSTFILCPDGTTLLIDAGTTDDSLEVSCAQKPNANRKPGEWIADYILRHARSAGRRELDYFLLTHIHPDHLGAVMDVDAHVPLKKLIDRAFPDYTYPAPQQAPFAKEYLEFVQSRRQTQKACERARVGRTDQIGLASRSYPEFAVRTLAANGEVWMGSGENTRQYFTNRQPTENMCSVAVRINYGKFSYYTGGDLTCDTQDGEEPWRDIETPVAKAAGRVDVAVANHHGYFDAVGADFVRALQPRVFVIPTWYVAHPSVLPLRRMVSEQLYKGARDVFATDVMAANRLVNNQFLSQLKSLEGHVVVRVAPGGGEYRVIVLDNADDFDRVKMVSGPYITGSTSPA